ARHQFEGRGSCRRTGDIVDNACGVAAIFGAVHGVDLLVDVVTRDLNEVDIFFDTTELNMPFMPYLYPTKPRSSAPVNRPDVEIVTEVDNPDGSRHSQAAITPA